MGHGHGERGASRAQRSVRADQARPHSSVLRGKNFGCFFLMGGGEEEEGERERAGEVRLHYNLEY